jgi:hypothetical protein
MTHSRPIPPAPPGYKHHKYLFEEWEARERFPMWLMILWANFVALIPLAVGVLVLWFPYQVYKMLGAPYAILPKLTLSLPLLIGLGFVVIGGSMLLHEWLHGLALSWFGYKPRYAFNKYYLLATIEDGTFLTQPHYLRMTLTPLVLITIMGAMLLPFLPPVIGQVVLIAVLLNLAASLGDIMVAINVNKMPQDAKFADDHGIHVYLPVTQQNSD